MRFISLSVAAAVCLNASLSFGQYTMPKTSGLSGMGRTQTKPKVLVKVPLPDIFDELGLDKIQQSQAEIVWSRYAAADFQQPKVAKKFREEIAKILTDAQEVKLAEVMRQIDEGIELGDGIYRSYRISPDDVGLKFTIINRSGKTANRRLIVDLFDKNNTRLQHDFEYLNDLEDGQSQEVKVVVLDSDRVASYKIKLEGVKNKADKKQGAKVAK